jgi:hypothetical protein
VLALVAVLAVSAYALCAKPTYVSCATYVSSRHYFPASFQSDMFESDAAAFAAEKVENGRSD